MKKIVAFIIIGVLALAGAAYGIMSFEWIDTGKVGVVYSMNGGVKDEVLTQGIHFISPFDKVKQFTISNEQLILSKDTKEGSEEDESFKVSTADNASIAISFQMSYRFKDESVTDTYKKFKGMDGEDIVDRRVKTVLKSKVSEVTSKYDLMEIYSGNRSVINNELTKYLNEQLTNEYGIEVLDASIIDVHPDKTLEESIQKRLNAMQEAETAKTEQEKVKVEMETKLLQAEKNAEIKKTEADAEAYANEKLSKSITQELIDMKEAEARLEHGWLTVQGADAVVTDAKEK